MNERGWNTAGFRKNAVVELWITEGEKIVRKAATIFILVYWLHLLLKLNIYCCIAAGIWLWFSFDFHAGKIEKAKNEWKELEEVSLYMELLLQAFRKEEKVFGAMEEVLDNLPKGRIQAAVRASLHHLEAAYDENAVMEHVVEQIEREFPLKRLSTIHHFMLQAEYYGGNISGPVDILLEDRKRWEARIRKDRKEREHMYLQILLSVGASLLICSIVMYMPVKNMDISGNFFVQLITLMVLSGDDLIIGRAQEYLRPPEDSRSSAPEDKDNRLLPGKGNRLLPEKGNRLLRGKNQDGRSWPEKLQEYRTYKEEKESRFSLLLSVFPGIFSLAALLTGKKWLAGGLLLTAVFLVNQHSIGHSLQKRQLTEEIGLRFPEWMMQIALLLQGDNVHMAIEKSVPEAPAILKKDLQRLLEGMENAPEAVAPFHDFMKEFSMPEVQSAMSSLYAIAAGSCSDSKKQFDQMIEVHMDMLDHADTHRLQEKTGGMYLLFLLPVVTASAKLLVDMTVFLIGFTSYL